MEHPRDNTTEAIGREGTLLGRILELESETYRKEPPSGGHFAHIPRSHFEIAPVVEATGALTYFYERTRAGDCVELRSYPNLIPPVEGMCFIEGVTDAWADYPQFRPGSGPISRIGYAVLRQDRPEIEENSLPQQKLLDRAGAMTMLYIHPYFEQSDRVWSLPAMWAMPVRADGRASLPNGKPYISVPGQGLLQSEEEKYNELRTVMLGILGGALFSVCVMNTVYRGLASYRGDLAEHIELEVEGPRKRLDKRGKANKRGLAYALNTCRGDFH